MADHVFDMKMDFGDDGSGANEFKKVKDKKFHDLSGFKMDETLSDLERSLILIQTGVPIQISCAFGSLSRISKTAVVATESKTKAQQQETIAQNWNERLVTLFDVAVSTVTDNSTEEDVIAKAVSAASEFSYYVETHPSTTGETDLDSIHNVSTQFLRLILAVLNRTGENAKLKGRQLALQTLPNLMACVPLESSISIAIPMAVVMADVSRSDENRIVACKLLGAIAQADKLEEKQSEDLLLPVVIRLCQDTAAEVREAMSRQLDKMIRGLTTASLVEKVSSELMELLEDEKDHVRFAALSTTIAMIDVLPCDLLTRKILLIIKASCDLDELGGETKMAPSIPEHFGVMFYRIFNRTGIFDDASIKKEYMDHFLKCYKTMSVSNNDATRRWCAYNYPAVLKTVGVIRFEDHFLQNILVRFARDTSVAIRGLVAKFFHEICGILTPNQCASSLRDILILLLQDADIKVRRQIVQHLDIILGCFDIEDKEARKLQYQDFLPAIAACSKDGSNEWRLHHTLLGHYIQFPKYFNHATLVRLLVPQLIKMMDGSGQQILHSCCRVIAMFGRNCPETRCHEEMMRRYENQYSCAESYTKRRVYLIACEVMFKTHSVRFGRERLLLTVVTLLDDLVLDIRRKALMLIPLLWHILIAKEDKAIQRNLLERLDIEASATKQALLAQTAVQVKFVVEKLMDSSGGSSNGNGNGGSGTTMGGEDSNIVRKKRDQMLEEQEIALGVYKTQEVSDSRKQIINRLVASNKALRKAQSKGIISVSSDEEDVLSVVRTSKLSSKKFKKKNEIIKGTSSNGGTGGTSNGRKKPAVLPRSKLPVILGSEKGTREAEVMASSSSSSSNGGSGRAKPKRRGPPGKSRKGPPSPRTKKFGGTK